MQDGRGRRGSLLAAEAMAVGFMGVVAAGAHASGVTLLLFPELAALAHDVLTRPRGRWASEPLKMIVAPTLAGAVGLVMARHAAYGAIPILAVVVAGILIVGALRTSMTPALSAGLLPMVLGERHWMYPIAIGAGLTGLAVLLRVWQRYGPALDEERTIEDALESGTPDRLWLTTMMGFVLALASLAELTGLRFILFPPLVVMAYEILGHPELPGWMERPALFPVVCFLTASVGWAASRIFHDGTAGVVVAVAGSMALLRVFRLHMPPALAIGVLPFVIQAPRAWFPVSVAIGTSALLMVSMTRGWAARCLAGGETSADAGS